MLYLLDIGALAVWVQHYWLILCFHYVLHGYKFITVRQKLFLYASSLLLTKTVHSRVYGCQVHMAVLYWIMASKI